MDEIYQLYLELLPNEATTLDFIYELAHNYMDQEMPFAVMINISLFALSSDCNVIDRWAVLDFVIKQNKQQWNNALITSGELSADQLYYLGLRPHEINNTLISLDDYLRVVPKYQIPLFDKMRHYMVPDMTYVNLIQSLEFQQDNLANRMFAEEPYNRFLNQFQDYENTQKVELYIAKETVTQIPGHRFFCWLLCHVQQKPAFLSILELVKVYALGQQGQVDEISIEYTRNYLNAMKEHLKKQGYPPLQDIA